MKAWTLFLLIPVIALMWSCASPVISKKQKARITYYHKHEDRWGDQTACGIRAREGVTVAAEPILPLGSQVYIPGLGGRVGEGQFIVQDRGSAVAARTATHGLLPIFDVYCATKKKYNYCRKYMPEIMEVQYR